MTKQLGKNIGTYMKPDELEAFWEFIREKGMKSESLAVKTAVLKYIKYKPPKPTN